MPEMTLVERLLSYYGFPVAFSFGLLLILYKLSTIAWKKFEPMVDALTDYFLGLPEYEKKKMQLIEESRAIAIETRDRASRIEQGVMRIKAKVYKKDDADEDGE